MEFTTQVLKRNKFDKRRIASAGHSDKTLKDTKILVSMSTP